MVKLMTFRAYNAANPRDRFDLGQAIDATPGFFAGAMCLVLGSEKLL
jgi:hypothetical protein